MSSTQSLGSVMALILLAGMLDVSHAEEYMKRGATVEDYEQALNRVMERRRGLVTARQLDSTASHSRVAQAKIKTHADTGSASGVDVYTPPSGSGDVADGVSIYFGFDSAELTRSARNQLERLGEALAKPEFAGVSWLVEGHTDATGAEAYNQTLSEQRARSARRFLVERCGIDEGRLIAVGKGEREPYDSRHPEANVNRRVRLSLSDG